MEEKKYSKISKKAIGCMLVNEVIAGIFVTALAIGGFVISSSGKNVPFSYNIVWAVVGIIWIACLVAPFVRYERYRYCITEEEIDIKEGFISIERNIVPIERLHKIAMEIGPIDRLFGLSKVIVTTAGGDVDIRFLQYEEAQVIVDSLKRRINQYAIAKREE